MRLLVALVLTAAAAGQTTLGIVSGRVRSSSTGAPLSGATVSYRGLATATTGSVAASRDGSFACPLLPPGRYSIRVEAGPVHQPKEIQELDLAVGSRVDIDFSLRPLAEVFDGGEFRGRTLPGSRAIVTFFGPDLDTSRTAAIEPARPSRGSMDTSLSEAIEPAHVAGLPFGGRDLYTMLATQPGVASDTGSARGLGLSANGQRPTASNFLLDGLENNDYLNSGPLGVVAPEAMQEYRVSTNNFSAEYGRASGYVANAVTKSGGSAWHGLLYHNLRAAALNANDFQLNASGLPKPPLRETQPGFQSGGPLRRDRVFVSAAWERTGSRGFSPRPATFTLPSAGFDRLFPLGGPLARRLMRDFPGPAPTARTATVDIHVTPPQTQNRLLGVQRADWLPGGGRQRLGGRFIVQRSERPDFIWSPYPDFVSGLEQRQHGIAIWHQFNHSSGLVSETRGGWSRDSLGWDRARPEIPSIASLDGVTLPGSPSSYGYRHRNRTFELAGNASLLRGRHAAKAGVGLLSRDLSGALGFGRDGLVTFDSYLDFVADAPSFYWVSVARQPLPTLRHATAPERRYSYRQAHGFAQDTIRIGRRASITAGLRLESFGGPRNTGGAADAIPRPGGAEVNAQTLAAAKIDWAATGPLFDGGTRAAARIGATYGTGRILVRGAFGTFHDRPFDNLWRNAANNDLTLGRFGVDFGQRVDYLAPPPRVLTNFAGQSVDGGFPRMILPDPRLTAGASHSYLFGTRAELTETAVLEVNASGSLSRGLVSSDIVNRDFSVRLGAGNFTGRFNPALPEISYVANQASGSYHALSATLRWRGRGKQLHAAYTWSHAIDNQSEPLDADTFDLAFTRATAGSGAVRPSAAFSRQFDPGLDRAGSDFDQRHNFVTYSLWDLPGPAGPRWMRAAAGGWKLAHTAALRTGFPYSVLAAGRIPPAGQGAIYNTRVTAISDPLVNVPVSGGRRLLEAAAFRVPAGGQQGNTGRNAFRAPGLYSLDLSLAKTFPVAPLGEAGRVTIRWDWFNALNHANLGRPENRFGASGFGVATYGRQGSPSFFPSLLPFQETARQAQILLRLEF